LPEARIPVADSSLGDRLRELEALRTEGLLSDGEFEVQKQRLLRDPAA